MTVLRLYTTGRVVLRGPAGSVDEADLPGELGRLLLVRLAIARHPIDRDDLIDDLWAGAAPPAVESVLNATLSRVRRSLSAVGVDGRAVLRARAGTVELARASDSWCDLEEVRRSVDAAEGHRRRGDLRSAWAEAVVGQAIARRPLLPGVHRVWLDDERSHLESLLRRALGVLVDVWLGLDDPVQAADMARELVGADPYSESSHRRLVMSLLASGDLGAAARAVDDWEHTLVEELGLPPDGRLRSLLRSSPDSPRANQS